MCFSAEASFTSALVLGGIGYTTIKSVSMRYQLFLAAIPLLFAIQQFSEGILWLNLGKQISLSALTLLTAKRTFLIFAFLIWPVWIPLSLFLVEKVAWRRHLILFDLACGVVLSFLNLSIGLQQDPTVQVANHSLQYLGYVPSQYYIYPLIIILP